MMDSYLYRTSRMLVVLILCTAQTVAARAVEGSRRVVFKTHSTGVPYRIPAMALTADGRLLAVADFRHCHADIGFGRIDLHVSTSADGGQQWSAPQLLAQGNDSLQGNAWAYAFGDACVVADADSPEVLLCCVGGHVSFWQSAAENPQQVVRFRSHDGGRTWDGGRCITPGVYGLYPSNPDAIFLTSGRIVQSRQVRVGSHRRLYVAHPVRPGGASVMYSDDFGDSWQVLGHGTHLPSATCDEACVEEMPDGSVLLSVRAAGKRMMNVFHYSDVAAATGSWSTEAPAGGMSGVNACNGELLLVEAVSKASGRPTHLVLQSLPQAAQRTNLGFFFKEMDTPAAYATGAAAADGWQRGLCVSPTTSCYSTMLLLPDGTIGLLYEENEQNDGYDIVFQRFALEEITGGQYIIVPSASR